MFTLCLIIYICIYKLGREYFSPDLLVDPIPGEGRRRLQPPTGEPEEPTPLWSAEADLRAGVHVLEAVSGPVHVLCA